MTEQAYQGVANPTGGSPENNNAGGQQPNPSEGENSGGGQSEQVDLKAIVNTLNQLNEKIDKQVVKRMDGITKDFVNVRHEFNDLKTKLPQDQEPVGNYDYPDSPELAINKKEEENSNFFIEQAVKDFQRENPDLSEDDIQEIFTGYYRRENANQQGRYLSKEAVLADYRKAARLRNLDKTTMNNQPPASQLNYGSDATPPASGNLGIINQQKKRNLKPEEEREIIAIWGSVDAYFKAKDQRESKNLGEIPDTEKGYKPLA